jgi:hypothetical protein
MLDELDLFEDGSYQSPNFEINQKIPDVESGGKNSLAETESIRNNDNLDPDREQELISEMEKFLGEEKETNIATKNIDILEEDPIVNNDKTNSEVDNVLLNNDEDIIVPDSTSTSVISGLDVPNENISSSLDDLNILPDIGNTQNDDEPQKEKEITKSEDDSLSFLDDLDNDIVETNNNTSSSTTESTKSENDSQKEFNVDEFLANIEQFGARETENKNKVSNEED